MPYPKTLCAVNIKSQTASCDLQYCNDRKKRCYMRRVKKVDKPVKRTAKHMTCRWCIHISAKRLGKGVKEPCFPM